MCDTCTLWIALPWPGGNLSYVQRSKDAVNWTPAGGSSGCFIGLWWDPYGKEYNLWSTTVAWQTVGDKNYQPLYWMFTWMNAIGFPPKLNQTVVSWSPYNTVVHAPDTAILYDPNSTDSDLNHPTIHWTIDHMNWNPTFHVQVGIKDLGGNTIKTINAYNVGLGPGAVQWDGTIDLGRGGYATKGVYLYQVQATHQCNGSDMMPECTDCAFVDGLVLSGDVLDQAGNPVLTPCLYNLNLWPNLDLLSFLLTSDVSRPVGSCSAQVFDPKLNQCFGMSLPTSPGLQETAPIWITAVSGTQGSPPYMPFTSYSLVVHATQTAQDGAANRDGAPKPTVPRGDIGAYAISVYGWGYASDGVYWTRTRPALTAVGYNTSNLFTSPCSTAGAQSALPNAAVFINEGHGNVACSALVNKNQNGQDVINGAIFDYDMSQGQPAWYSNNMAPYSINVRDYAGCWPNLLFVAYIACHTGATTPNSDLLTGTGNAGARAALGFTDTIYGAYGTAPFYTIAEWTDQFMFDCAAGESVQAAADDALGWVKSNCNGYDAGLGSVRIVNNALLLRPARYGWGG